MKVNVAAVEDLPESRYTKTTNNYKVLRSCFLFNEIVYLTKLKLPCCPDKVPHKSGGLLNIELLDVPGTIPSIVSTQSPVVVVPAVASGC